MNPVELEELVAIIRQFIQKARNRNDTFEYCRLCDELLLAEAALADTGRTRPTALLKSVKPLPLALA